MGLSQSQWTILFLLWPYGCSSEAEDKCINYKPKVNEVFSVPGDVAMLSSSLASSDLFNITSVPYNISWYDLQTGREMTSVDGRILVLEETLWFLKVELEDTGEYECVVRTPSQCYRQAIKLVVDPPVLGECGRPRKAQQNLSSRVNDILFCPLIRHIEKLKSYSVSSSIKWFKGCTPIGDGNGKFTYLDNNRLKLEGVEPEDNGFYTCTLTFTLGGVTGSTSETIDAKVKENYFLHPEVHEPTDKVIKKARGSSFIQRCLVFVPSVGSPLVDIYWIAQDEFVSSEPSDRVHAELQHQWREESPREGMWFESKLKFSEVREEDFYINYTCKAYSDRGNPERQFLLLPEDPNIVLPMGLVMGLMVILFINSVVLYYLFKIDIVLWFRRAFPVLYTNTESDGKLYDAYVAYPQQFGHGGSDEVEMFALHTLPQVLEKAYGYKLFIPGRDCLPGQAVMDSVEENMQASRRLLLLYTASTFAYNSNSSDNCNNNISRKNSEHSICNNNNNDEDVTLSGMQTTDTSNCTSVNPNSSNETSSDQLHSYEERDNTRDQKTSDSDEDGRETSGYGKIDTMLRFLYDTAMHRTLLERSLKVVLVEMEEVTPEQLALFPESVHHLRRKQGAVCWWKNQGNRNGCRTCVGWDEEKGGQESYSVSPSSWFWRQIRYYMPVRGKRVSYPEKTSLLNL